MKNQKQLFRNQISIKNILLPTKVQNCSSLKKLSSIFLADSALEVQKT